MGARSHFRRLLVLDSWLLTVSSRGGLKSRRGIRRLRDNSALPYHNCLFSGQGFSPAL